MNETNPQTSQTEGMTIEELRRIQATTGVTIVSLARRAREARVAQIAQEEAERVQKLKEGRRASATKMHELITKALNRFFGGVTPACTIKWHYEGAQVSSADLEFSGVEPFFLSAVFPYNESSGNKNVTFQYDGLYLVDVAHLGELIELKEVAPK